MRHNKAETGNGGVSGDSFVSIPVSTAVFSQNVAAQQGGGLFIGAGPAEFDSSKAMEFSVAKVTFWRLDLVDNAAPTIDVGVISYAGFVRHVFEANRATHTIDVFGHSWSPDVGPTLDALYQPAASHHEMSTCSSGENAASVAAVAAAICCRLTLR